MPYLDLPTHRLHYRIDGPQGDKPWLVFCNSLGTDLQMWDAQAAALSRDFRILRHDRRGHGLSGTPPAPYALADLGQDVIALLDGLDIARAQFCGLPIGGLTGQWLAVHRGNRLGRIALCATAARIGTAKSWQGRMAEVAAHGLDPLVPATEARWFSPGFAAARPRCVTPILDGFAATPRDGYLGCCAALAGADLRPDLARIANPVLAISGADDPVCPPADLAALAEGVQDGRHLSLPGRHMVNVESAPAFNTALRDFLSAAA